MNIREAVESDCIFIFNWRNDFYTKKMSLNNSEISYDEHCAWYEETLNNPLKIIFIGENDHDRVGVCRFDLDNNNLIAEISINLNPSFRGKGLGKDLLISSIDKFEKENKFLLVAFIKKENIASQNLFEYAGFAPSSYHDAIIKYELPVIKVSFREVTFRDSEILYKLLKNRIYNISHSELPSYISHKKFVDSHPYKHWYLIFANDNVKGSFYVKQDNSIGIDLQKPTFFTLREIVKFINRKLIINKALPSQVPPYFFINVAKSNKKMLEMLEKIGCEAIQVSLKINSPKN